MSINLRILWKISVFGVALVFFTNVFAQGQAYDLMINNQAVVFTFMDKTCNGGRIDNPPKPTLPAGNTQFEVQSDAQQGCMLRYSDNKGDILGIWIHQQQVDCSNQGGIFSYDCTYRNNELTINDS